MNGYMLKVVACRVKPYKLIPREEDNLILTIRIVVMQKRKWINKIKLIGKRMRKKIVKRLI